MWLANSNPSPCFSGNPIFLISHSPRPLLLVPAALRFSTVHPSDVTLVFNTVGHGSIYCSKLAASCLETSLFHMTFVDSDLSDEDESMPGANNMWVPLLDMAYHFNVGPFFASFLGNSCLARLAASCHFAVLVAPVARDSVEEFLWVPFSQQRWSCSNKGTVGMESSVALFKPHIHLFECTHPSVSNSLDYNDWLASSISLQPGVQTSLECGSLLYTSICLHPGCKHQSTTF